MLQPVLGLLEKCKMLSTMLVGPHLCRWLRGWYHLVAILTSGCVAVPVAEGVGAAAVPRDALEVK